MTIEMSPLVSSKTHKFERNENSYFRIEVIKTSYFCKPIRAIEITHKILHKNREKILIFLNSFSADYLMET